MSTLDLGQREFGVKDAKDRLKYYREFNYEKGKGLELGDIDLFRCRTRYFTDSGIIGSKVLVYHLYRQFKNRFPSKQEKHPKSIGRLRWVYSLKRLSETILIKFES